MRSNYRRTGDFIRLVDERNSEEKFDLLLGINIDKYFMPSVANVVGTDLSRYKVVKPGQFACNRMHVGRDYRLPVALSELDHNFIVSPAYDVFEVTDQNELLPEYLMMWFSRAEFDRNAWFYTDADVRGGLSWSSFCDMTLPVPDPEIQKEIVNEYKTIVNRIKLNEKLNQKLEETAQVIYKEWFVDFEFPDENGKPYKSSGGKMVWNEELGKEIPEGWEKCVLKDISNCLDYQRKPLSEVERKNFKGKFPYYGAMGIVDYVQEYIFDGEYLLFSEDGVNVINDKGYPSVFLINEKFWVNNHAHILQGKNTFSTRLVYSLLKEVNVSDLVTGAAQPKINQENMNSISLIKPKLNVAHDFDKIINPIFEKIQRKTKEIKMLSELNDLLISKMTKVET
ncbi:MAG: restriction endonuclease subunit S [Bacteroidales bacterium]|nr:restriction endonuclease subunit S [Bacteroidales bacterium]MCF8405235.1 restriction endonuclease subunit S [Bacteroidales bacterium]